MKLSERIQRNALTPYQQIAKRYGVSLTYVTMIANGRRFPRKKKGIQVLEQLEKLANNLDKNNK